MEAYPHRADEPERWTDGDEPNDRWRWVVDASGAAAPSPLAYLALWPVHAMQFRLDLVVDPASRRQGLGSRLSDFLIDRATTARATSVQARALSDSADALRFLETRGFRETMRMTGLALDDVAAVPLQRFERPPQALEARGVHLTTLAAELRDDSQSWEKLRDTNHAAQFGWPDPDPNPDGSPHPPESVDQFRAQAAQFGMIPEACFIAKAGDLYLGYSALTMSDKAREHAGSGGTAVRPEHRGLGIATVLKACCVRWARDNGVRRLATASGNQAMVHVNEKFGFRQRYVEMRLVKRLESGTQHRHG